MLCTNLNFKVWYKTCMLKKVKLHTFKGEMETIDLLTTSKNMNKINNQKC